MFEKPKQLLKTYLLTKKAGAMFVLFFSFAVLFTPVQEARACYWTIFCEQVYKQTLEEIRQRLYDYALATARQALIETINDVFNSVFGNNQLVIGNFREYIIENPDKLADIKTAEQFLTQSSSGSSSGLNYQSAFEGQQLLDDVDTIAGSYKEARKLINPDFSQYSAEAIVRSVFNPQPVSDLDVKSVCNSTSGVEAETAGVSCLLELTKNNPGKRINDALAFKQATKQAEQVSRNLEATASGLLPKIVNDQIVQPLEGIRAIFEEVKQAAIRITYSIKCLECTIADIAVYFGKQAIDQGIDELRQSADQATAQLNREYQSFLAELQSEFGVSFNQMSYNPKGFFDETKNPPEDEPPRDNPVGQGSVAGVSSSVVESRKTGVIEGTSSCLVSGQRGVCRETCTSRETSIKNVCTENAKCCILEQTGGR